MKQRHNSEYSAVRRQTGQCGYLQHTDRPPHAAFSYVALNAPTRPLMREAVKALIPHGFLDEGYNAKFNACARCQRCVPVRINLDKYKSRRSARRLRKNNNDLTFIFKDIDKDNIMESLGPDQFDLFSHFHKSRFPGQSFAHFDYLQFRDTFMTRDRTMEVRDKANKLVAMIVLTTGPDFVYGVNCFYDTEMNNDDRRLGRYTLLSVLKTLQDDPAMKYFYMGSWLDEKQSGLQYKTDFSGLEIITDEGWQDFDPAQEYQAPDYSAKLPASISWRYPR